MTLATRALAPVRCSNPPPAIVITDERADRMRMMAPVAAVDTLEPTGPPLTRHGDS